LVKYSLVKIIKYTNDFWRIRRRVVVFFVDADKGGVGYGRSAIECAAHADSIKMPMHPSIAWRSAAAFLVE
jgi:hypothetical protein